MLLSSFLDCPACGATVECFWRPKADDPEDIDEVPVAKQTCPCGHTWEAEFEGFTEYGSAGG